MHEVAVQDDRLRLGVADAALELPRHAVLEGEIHVDEIGAARHGDVLHLDALDVRQSLQEDLGTVDQPVGEISALLLAHFAAQHLVVDLVDPEKIDPPHVDATLGVDEEGDRDFLFLVVEIGHGLDLRIRIAFLAQAEGHELRGLREQAQVERGAGLGQDQPSQLLLGNHEVTDQLDAGDRVALARVDVDRDVDVL